MWRKIKQESSRAEILKPKTWIFGCVDSSPPKEKKKISKVPLQLLLLLQIRSEGLKLWLNSVCYWKENSGVLFILQRRNTCFLYFFCMDLISGFTKCILPSPHKNCFLSVCARGPREDVLIYFTFLSEGSAWFRTHLGGSLIILILTIFSVTNHLKANNYNDRHLSKSDAIFFE